jgi:GNAT superfamily N-acetyltransferase
VIHLLDNIQIKALVNQQLATDLNCSDKDLINQCLVTKATSHAKTRGFFKQTPFLYAVGLGDSFIATVSDEIKTWMNDFVKAFKPYRYFDILQLDLLNNELKKWGYQVAMIGEYYLPDANAVRHFDCKYEIKIFRDNDIKHLYKDDRFQMALMYGESPRKYDNIAAVAYNNHGNVIGVCATTKDSERMCSLGIDVIKEYRRQNIATTLVNVVTKTLLSEGLIPYYGTSVGNVLSKNLANKTGYYPYFVEIQTDKINACQTYLPKQYQKNMKGQV